MSVLVQEMIEAYIPVDDDGSDTTHKRVTEEFMEFHTQTGKWTHIFGQPLPEADNFEQLEANNKAFGVKFVKQHAENSGNVASRLRWFETFAAHSELVKPLKDTILTKKRNRQSRCTLPCTRESQSHYECEEDSSGCKSITDSIN
eukprot:scaffold45470_cov39-Cyclotella_meneghiniana.AAC.2